MGVIVSVKEKRMEEAPDVKIEFETMIRDGERYEVARVMERFSPSHYADVIKGRCDRMIVINLLEQLNRLSFRAIKTDNAIYISGTDARTVMRYVTILVGCVHCTKDPYKYVDLMYEVAGLGECEALFWFSRMVEAYESERRQNMCRMAKAFKILHKID